MRDIVATIPNSQFDLVTADGSVLIIEASRAQADRIALHVVSYLLATMLYALKASEVLSSGPIRSSRDTRTSLPGLGNEGSFSGHAQLAPQGFAGAGWAAQVAALKGAARMADSLLALDARSAARASRAANVDGRFVRSPGRRAQRHRGEP